MKHERGFTMIELMTAIALGLFIVYVAFAGFRAASAAMQSSQRLSIGNAMLRACVYYSFNRADGLSIGWMPSDYPDSWPLPTVNAPWQPSSRLPSCEVCQPSGPRGVANFRGPFADKWAPAPEDFFRLTPYGRDDPKAEAVERQFYGWGAKYWCAYVNDGTVYDPPFDTSVGRKLTTFPTRESNVQLIDVLSGRTTNLRFRVTGTTHTATVADDIGKPNTWFEIKEGM